MPTKQKRKGRTPVRQFAVALLGFGLISCAGNDTSGPVTGRIAGPGIPATQTELFTKPAAGGGVLLTASAGGGRRPTTIPHVDVVRVVNLVESTLARWPEMRGAPPFHQTLMMGVAGSGGANPFTLAIAKRPGMDDPVFLVSVGYIDAVGSLALDRENAQRWAAHLRRAASGY